MTRRIAWMAFAAALAALAASWWTFGRPAIRIESPAAGTRVGIDGIDLLARFSPEGAVEPATVRVLLNGADVSGDCAAARNGVQGRLHGLLEGENAVRVEAFVRRPGGLLVLEGREVRVWFRPPDDFDRG
jgi:hypothetical protein